MRDPLGLNERLFARYYPLLVERSEQAGQRETRASLLSEASGRTLELGAGSGLNLPHYTAAVSELVVTEPSPHMLAHLRAAFDSDPPPVGGWKLVQAGAERLPFEDQSFDTIVGTYILCTVPAPVRTLEEVARLLRPGGRYLFLEHVHAGAGTRGWGAFRTSSSCPTVTSPPAVTQTAAPPSCSGPPRSRSSAWSTAPSRARSRRSGR